MKRMTWLLLTVAWASCARPAGIDERRAQALEDLREPETRDEAATTLAELALSVDGDHERALAYLEGRSAPGRGAGAVVEALAQAGHGDLAREIDAWQRALGAGDPVASLAAVLRLSAMADYVPRARLGPLTEALSRVGGQAAVYAARLSRELRREPAPARQVSLAQVAERLPLSAFVDGRTLPEETPARPRWLDDGALALGNERGALARVRLAVPASTTGTWLVIGGPVALRVRQAGRDEVLHERDPTAGHPPLDQALWLDPSATERVFVVEVAAPDAHARLRLELAPGGAAPAVPADDERWLAWLVRAWLATAVQDAGAAHAAVERLSVLAPGLAAGRLAQADLGGPGPSPVALLGQIQVLGHAGVLRRLADEALAAGHSTQAMDLTEALQQVPDPRSALLAYRILDERGFSAAADAQLTRARRLAPDACAPARARLERDWTQLKLRGLDPATDLLPGGCAAEVRPLLASFYGETGRFDRALQALDADDAQVALRMRVLERAGRGRDAMALARRTAGSDLDGLERLAEQAAALGRTDVAAAAHREAAASSSSDFAGRLRLMAVGASRAWEAFRPDVEALLDTPPPATLQEGQGAVLLVDHATVLHFRDGGKVTHYHQVLRLLTPGALAELGEGSVPEDAMILRAVTRKADGRVLTPEETTQKDTISFPELEVGDAIELEYLTGDPPDGVLRGRWIDEPFYFGIFDIPTWHSQYVVLLQEGVQGTWEGRGRIDEPEPVRAEGFRGWRWRGGPREPTVMEPGAVAPFDALPAVQVASPIDWPELVALNREAVLRLAAPDFRVRELAHALVPADGSSLAGARTIYQWVRDEIREEMGAYLRISAPYAVANRRGERVIALLSLLRAAGYRAELAMIDPIHRHHAPRAIPDPRDFSYLAVRVYDRALGEWRWLDPHYAGAPFGFLAPTVRGRPAWVIATSGVLEQVTAPSEPVEGERRIVRVELFVNADGTVRGTWRERTGGMDAVVYREGLGPQPREERRAILAELLQDSLPGATITELEITGLEAGDEPLRFRYQLRLADLKGPRGTLRIGLTPLFANLRWIHLPRRDTALYADRQEDVRLDLRIRLAPGVRLLGDPPRTVTWLRPFGTYRREAQRLEDGLDVVRTLRMSPAIIEPEAYALFRDFCRAVDAGDRLEIQISLPSPAT